CRRGLRPARRLAVRADDAAADPRPDPVPVGGAARRPIAPRAARADASPPRLNVALSRDLKRVAFSLGELRSLTMERGGELRRADRALPAGDDDRRHRIADEVGEASAFAHEPVDAEDQ